VTAACACRALIPTQHSRQGPSEPHVAGVLLQALLGIPWVHSLRFDPRLSAFSRVWPSETGLGLAAGTPAASAPAFAS